VARRAGGRGQPDPAGADRPHRHRPGRTAARDLGRRRRRVPRGLGRGGDRRPRAAAAPARRRAGAVGRPRAGLGPGVPAQPAAHRPPVPGRRPHPRRAAADRRGLDPRRPGAAGGSRARRVRRGAGRPGRRNGVRARRRRDRTRDLVAVCAPKGPAQIAAILGVVRSGAGYVPVEPDWPAPRVAAVCRQAQLRHALVADPAATTWPDGVQVHALDLDGTLPGSRAPTPPRPRPTSSPT
jgi:hypothetical protein